MTTIHKAGLVSCSNGLYPDAAPELDLLQNALSNCGIESLQGRFLYQAEGPASAPASQRAAQLQAFLEDPSLDAVFDLSGGDLANELLDLLDYERLRSTRSLFWGYSDLTCILNALYAKAGKQGILYSVRTLAKSCGAEQCLWMQALQSGDVEPLFTLPVRFLNGNSMEGILLGGNVRCFLKLAGTPYFPDLTGKLLLLESLGGGADRICAFLAQLRQLGAFEKIAGLVLGTFTQLDKDEGPDFTEKLVLERVPKHLPVARTALIGHGSNSKAACIGGTYQVAESSARLVSPF